MNISKVHALAETVGNQLKQRQLQLVTAESCTGGQLAQTITSIPGSEKWFERGFITYSPLSKEEVLGVQAATLKCYGPISKETVEEMAKGALQKSPAHLSIAITGMAGPEEILENPVGTVYFAWANRHACEVQIQRFDGDRLIIRYAAVEFALRTFIQRLDVLN